MVIFPSFCEKCSLILGIRDEVQDGVDSGVAAACNVLLCSPDRAVSGRFGQTKDGIAASDVLLPKKESHPSQSFETRVKFLAFFT